MNALTDAVKGTHCGYALRLQGDANAPEYYYVGSTSDIQTRIAQHTGAIPGGAKWTALHPPVAIESVVPCQSAFQAACTELGMWGLYAGRMRDYDKVRGGKFCMCGALRFPPTGWKNERPTVESLTRSGLEGKRSLEVEDIEDFPLAKRAA